MMFDSSSLKPCKLRLQISEAIFSDTNTEAFFPIPNFPIQNTFFWYQIFDTDIDRDYKNIG